MTAVVEPEQTARGRPRAGVVVAIVAALVVAGWWAWPSLAGHDERLDVLVVGDDFLQRAQRSIELRVRESGRSVDWAFPGAGLCADPDALAIRVGLLAPTRVVLSFADGEQCLADLAARLDDVRVLAVVQPGAGPDAASLRAAGFDVVETERLLGSVGDTRRPCEWWETCEQDGQAAVRDGSGALTEAGHERVARMIVTGL